MADEGQVSWGITARKTVGAVTTLDFVRSAGFKFDIAGTFGPSPGSFTIPVGGRSIPLGDLVTAGVGYLRNMDATNYVTWGIYDPDNGRFYPVGELRAGESFPLRFSRDLLEEYQGTGTGTGPPGNQFFMKANTADVVVDVEILRA